MNKRYVIFSVSELPLVNFDEVLETSVDTLRYSIDRSLTFVKYIGDMPLSIVALTTKSQEYTNEELLVILRGPQWTEIPNPSGSL